MNTPLQQAAQAMIDRWESPDWKDTPHTAHYVAELRKALDAEIAQSVEPVAWAMRRADGLVLDVICPDEHESHEGEYKMPLYLHPPQPQATTPAAPEGYVLVSEETLLSIKGRVNTLATLSLKAERYSVGIAIKQTIADILAAQGEKP